MLWYITYNRIECGVHFLLYDNFFTLVRVTAHGTNIQFAQVKNFSTKKTYHCSLSILSGATMLESSAYLKRARVEPTLISRSFRYTLNK